MSFIDYYMELKGTIPSLPVPLAQTIVSRAWVDIQKARLWSFLRGSTSLLIPDALASGSVLVSQFSNQVVADTAVAAPLWAAQTLPLLTSRQFRVGFGAPIYNIWGYDAATGIITLDRPYAEATNVVSPYVLYKCYFAAPVADFKRWETVTNLRDSYPLALNHTRQEVERRDPQRNSATNNPYWMVAFQSDQNPKSPTYRRPMFELWEHCTAALGLMATFQRYGQGFQSDDDDVILPVTPEMLMTRARYLAYEYAEANKGRVVELRGSNWPLLMTMSEGRYQKMLKEAALLDEEIYQSDVIYENTSDSGIFNDTNYRFNHGV